MKNIDKVVAEDEVESSIVINLRYERSQRPTACFCYKMNGSAKLNRTTIDNG